MREEPGLPSPSISPQFFFLGVFFVLFYTHFEARHQIPERCVVDHVSWRLLQYDE